MSFELVEAFLSDHKIGIIAASVILVCLKKYFNGGHCYDKTRLDGKTVLITGANTGIGKETALDLAKRGARIIMACRDMVKAESAAKFVREKSGNGNVVVQNLDLASLKSVAEFAKKINEQEERIDILINNAGIMACPKWKTTDGFEMQFGTNHLGHFFLTELLLEKIKSSGPSRIINLSSLAYKKGRMDWSDINSDKNYHHWKVYEKSKLCNILFTRELAKRLEGTKVTVNALHPGVVRTELGRHLNERNKLVYILAYPFVLFIFKNIYQGTQTSIYCAVSPELDNVTGCYFADCKKEELLPHALNEQDAKKLWELSDEFCKPFRK